LAAHAALTCAPSPAEALAYLRDALQKCENMEPVYWQRREGALCAASSAPLRFPKPDAALRKADLESRRVDVSNKTYKDSKVDLSYPAPGCGAGPWDGIPPGCKAQAIDLQVAAPVLQKLGLPPTWDGAALHVTPAGGARLRRALLGVAQATRVSLAGPTWARTWRAARSGARRRRTPRWRRCATRWRSRRRCTEGSNAAFAGVRRRRRRRRCCKKM